MGYHLLSNPNPHGPFYYTTRRNPIQLVVVHTAENLPDWNGRDEGAENIAAYASHTTRPVSWHSTVDSDTTIPMLPDGYTAFHVRGYNSRSLGIEIATQAHRWGDGPSGWERRIVSRAAAQVRDWCLRHRIPTRRISKTQADAGLKGIVAHADLDPSRRSDPGVGFPWGTFLSLVSQGEEPVTDPADVRYWQTILKMPSPGHERAGIPYDIGPVDGVLGPKTEAAIRDWQRRRGIAVTGTLNLTTCCTLQSHANRVHATQEAKKH